MVAQNCLDRLWQQYWRAALAKNGFNFRFSLMKSCRRFNDLNNSWSFTWLLIPTFSFVEQSNKVWQYTFAVSETDIWISTFVSCWKIPRTAFSWRKVGPFFLSENTSGKRQKSNTSNDLTFFHYLTNMIVLLTEPSPWSKSKRHHPHVWQGVGSVFRLNTILSPGNPYDGSRKLFYRL